MTRISVAQAKNHLSELIVRVEAGEEISVTRHGKPVARLVAEPPPAALSAIQRDRVQRAVKRLTDLRHGLRMDGDLKVIARKGLD